MAGNKSITLFLLLLAFLFLLTAPFVLIFGHYSGLLQLPHFVTYHNVSIAATAGLFVIPAFFIYAAAIIVAMKKSRSAGIGLRPAVSKAVVVKPAHYPWEDVFGHEKEMAAEKPHRQIHGKKFAVNRRALAAVIIVLAIIGIIVLFSIMPNNNLFGGHNETKSVNVTTAVVNAPANASEVRFFSRLLSTITKLQPAQTTQAVVQPAVKEVKPQAKAAPARVSLLTATKSFGSKARKGFLSSLGSVKLRVSKVNPVVWRNMSIALIAVLLAASLFYSRRTGQLGGISKWLRDWVGWLTAVLAAARKNKLKALLWLVFVAVVCAAAAAVVFRKRVIAKFPSVSASGLVDVAVNALAVVRDFVSVYRLYIIIGIFALFAIIGVLFIYETREKKGKNG